MFKIFKPVPIQTIIENNLEEHERNLINEQAKAAYHEKMAEYYEEEILRLKRYATPEVAE